MPLPRLDRTYIVKKFKEIRDIPYRIPLSLDEPDNCCSGKSERLFKIFTNAGYQARFRICTCLWSDLSLPAEVKEVPQYEGTVTRLNQKTITVTLDNGEHWNVSPDFLKKIDVEFAHDELTSSGNLTRTKN